MMENPLEIQNEVYGSKGGPPMLYEEQPSKPYKQQQRKRRKLKGPMTTDELINLTRQRQAMVDENNLLSPCTLPGDFPPELSYRALAVYSLLRTLSRELRLSPFTPNVFLRALYLPFPNKVLGQIHVALLRVLLPNLQMGYGYKPRGGGIHVYKRRNVDHIRWPLRGGDNLTYLDGFSWPLFYDDYCHLTADRIWAQIHDQESHIDFRYMGMQHMEINDYEEPPDKRQEKERIPLRTLPPQYMPFPTQPISMVIPPSAALPIASPPAPGLAQSTSMAQTTPKVEILDNGEMDGDSDSEYNSEGDDDDDDFDLTWSTRKEKRRRAARKKKSPATVGPAAVIDPTRTVDISMSGKQGPIQYPLLAPKTGSINASSIAVSGKQETVISPHQTTQPLLPIHGIPSKDTPVPSKKAPVLSNTATPSAEMSSRTILSGKQSTVQAPSTSKGPIQSTESNDATATPKQTPNATETTSASSGTAIVTSERQTPRDIGSKVLEVMSPAGLLQKSPEAAKSLTPSSLKNKIVPGPAVSCSPKQKVASKVVDVVIPERGSPPFSQPPSLKSNPNAVSKELYKVNGAYSGKFKENEERKHVSPASRQRQLPIMSKIGSRNLFQNTPVEKKTSPSQTSGNSSQKVKKPRGRPRKLPLHNSAAKRPPPAEPDSQPVVKKQALMVPPQQNMAVQPKLHFLQMQQQQLQLQRQQQLQMQLQQQQQQQQLQMQRQQQFQMQQQRQFQMRQQQQFQMQQQIQMQQLNYQRMMAVSPAYPSSSGMFGRSPYGMPPQVPSVPLSFQQWRMMKESNTPPSNMMSRAQITNPHDQPLEVPENVATDLQDFMCGVVRKKPTSESTKGENSEASDPSVKDGDSPEFNDSRCWAHFEPLKTMRSGIPYHKTSVDEKITILEFLLDELLCIDAISAEFSRRQTISDCYTTPFGLWPTESEFRNLENADECGVCGGEGELLCCDGCVSSYHRRCLDMSEGQALPEGKWLCPECKLVDPSLFGPLHGGRKASLDWFSINDIMDVLKQRGLSADVKDTTTGDLQTALPEDLPAALPATLPTALPAALPTTLLHHGAETIGSGPSSQPLPSTASSISLAPLAENPAQIPTVRSEDPTKFQASAMGLPVPPQNSANGEVRNDGPVSDQPLQIVAPCKPPAKKFTVPPSLQDKEFLIIHGFVFCRKTMKPKHTIEDRPNAESPYTVLSLKEMEAHLDDLGLEMSSLWPLVQVPRNGVHHDGHFPPISLYMKAVDSFDPSFYSSKYRKAPIPLLMKATGGGQIEKLALSDYECECGQANTYKISEALIRDLTLDRHISGCLRNDLTLFDPYQMVKGYMVRTESLLKKACLLNEFWETGKDRTRHEIWLDNVRNCKSVKRLGRLLLLFVDQVHPRAFGDGWYYNPSLKGSEAQTPISDRHFEDLPQGWNEKDEKRKHLWEQTPGDNILSLVEKEECNLRDFVEGIKIDFSEPFTCARSKRKQAKSDPSNGVKSKKALDNKGKVPKDSMQSSSTGALQPKASDSAHSPDSGELEETASNKKPVVLLPDPTSDGAGENRGFEQHIGDRDETNMFPRNDLELSTVSATVKSTEPKTSGSMLAPTKNDYEITNGQKATALENARSSEDPNDGIGVNQNDGVPVGSPSITVDVSSSTQPSREEAIPPPHARVPGEAEDQNTLAGNDEEGKAVTEGASEENAEVVQKKKKTKKKPKKATNPANRRTRRSGRRFMHQVNGEPTVNVNVSSDADTQVQVQEMGALEAHIDMLKKSKVPGIEKNLKGLFQKELPWPVAGRDLFFTVGNLPPREMKHLARRAGVVRAAHVAYNTSHEVGQVCWAYVWRKRVEQAASFEELLLLIRIFESFLDRTTIHSCENVVRRGKGQIQKVIRCSLRHPRSGAIEHFVVNKNRMKGCWISVEQIDVSSFILENFNRRQRQASIHAAKVQAKEQAEKERLSRERAERAEVERRLRAEEAKKKEEARRAKLEAAAKEKKEREKALAASLQLETTKWKDQLNDVVSKHRDGVIQIFQSRLLNEGSVPSESQLEALRNRTMSQLNEAAGGLRKCNVGLNMTETELTNLMSSHETQVLQLLSRTAGGPTLLENLARLSGGSAAGGVKQPAPKDIRGNKPTQQRRPKAQPSKKRPASGISRQVMNPMATPNQQSQRVQAVSASREAMRHTELSGMGEFPVSGSYRNQIQQNAQAKHTKSNARRERKTQQSHGRPSAAHHPSNNPQLDLGDDLDMDNLFDDGPSTTSVAPSVASIALDLQRNYYSSLSQNRGHVQPPQNRMSTHQTHSQYQTQQFSQAQLNGQLAGLQQVDSTYLNESYDQSSTIPGFSMGLPQHTRTPMQHTQHQTFQQNFGLTGFQQAERKPQPDPSLLYMAQQNQPHHQQQNQPDLHQPSHFLGSQQQAYFQPTQQIAQQQLYASPEFQQQLQHLQQLQQNYQNYQQQPPSRQNFF